MIIPYRMHQVFAAHTAYRCALFETLIYLQPKFCLEIGTNHGASTTVFQRYFDEYQPEGHLITCDIKLYNKLNLPNVTQLQVHSWINNPWDWHVGNDSELLIDDERHNLQIIKDKMSELNIPHFDFIFIDGDHTALSVRADLLMCATLPMTWPRYTMIDDTDSQDQDVGWIYRDTIKQNPNLHTYDYDNWNTRVGASLVWCKGNEPNDSK